MPATRKPRRLNKPHFELLSGRVIRIPLTKGMWALISVCDLRRVIRYSWCVHPAGDRFYAQANVKVDGVWKRVLLHRYLTGAPKGMQVDHKDNDGLNNTRENLRVCTQNNNQHNSKAHRDGGSRFKGVSWSKGMKRWHAQITKDRKYYDVGYFDSEEAAALAYDAKARELHGEFAKTNFG